MSKIALQSWNGLWLCAEGGGGSNLTANRRLVGPWETFDLTRNGRQVTIRSDRGYYVCAVGGGGGAIEVNKTEAHQWETFTHESVPGGLSAFRTEKGFYLCAEGGGGRDVVANRSARRQWESFRMLLVGDGPKKFTNGAPCCVIVNSSDHSIYAKPEVGNGAVEIPPNSKTEMGFDGLAIPHREPGKVLKVVDGCDVVVTRDGWEVDCKDGRVKRGGFDVPGWMLDVAQATTGGWKDSDFLEAHPDWSCLFFAANPSKEPPPSENCPPDRREHIIEIRRKSFDEIDRDQYNIYKAKEHENIA